MKNIDVIRLLLEHQVLEYDKLRVNIEEHKQLFKSIIITLDVLITKYKII